MLLTVHYLIVRKNVNTWKHLNRLTITDLQLSELNRNSGVSEDTELNVLLETHDDLHAAITTIFKNFNLSVGSVHKILEVNKYDTYKNKLLNEFLEDDFERRVKFC